MTAQNDDPTAMPFGVAGADVPSVVIESQPGDVIVFPEHYGMARLVVPPGRSQHAINFMANPVTVEQVAYVKGLYEGWNFSLHPAAEMINSDRPRLRRMVSRLVELGFGPPKPNRCLCEISIYCANY